jgi:hypothetical protein
MWRVIISLFVVLQFSYADNMDFTEKSKKALDGIVKKQIEKMSNLANSTESANEKNVKGYVLSSHIRTFSDIDAHVKSEINSMRNEIKSLIIRIASEIEVNNDRSGKLDIDDRGNVYYHSNKKLPKDTNNKQEKLLKANLQNSVSVRSIELAVRLLANINSELIKQGKNAQTSKQKEKIYMKQAVYVYEMSDMLLELLNKISLDGTGVIYSIYDETKSKVKNSITNIDEKKKKVDSLVQKGMMSQKNGTKEKESLNLLQQANAKQLEVWVDILKTIGSQKKFLAHLKQQKELIEYKRDVALIQVETLRDIKIVKEVKETIGSFDKLVDSVSSLELLVLDEYTVRQLLGISE